MILVDSSVWIDLLIDPRRAPHAASLATEFVTCDPILQEVLQGLDPSKSLSVGFRNVLMALPLIGDPVTKNTYLAAAEIYSHGRRRGYTIRSSVDCLIAAIALENDVVVWHRDRDYVNIARYSPLKQVTKFLT